MRIFLIKTLFYLCFTMLIAYLLQSYIDNKFRNIYDDTYADWNRLFKGEINADIVILGSSRAWVHYNPEIFENKFGLTCYNLGLDGGGLAMQKAKWDSYIANNKPPKFVIQDIDLLTFGSRNDNEIFKKYRFLPYLNKETIYSNLSLIDPFIKLEAFIPLIKYRGYKDEILNLLIENKINKERNKKGFLGQKKQFDSLTYKKMIVNNDVIVKSEEQIKLGERILLSLIKECKKNNTTVILAHSPIFSNALTLFPQQKDFINIIHNISMNNECEFLDFSNDSINRDTINFYNTTHLNYKGADKFSNKFVTALQKLNIISNRAYQ